MSKPLDMRQSNDSKGTIVKGRDGKILFAAGVTVPVDASIDYAPGCIFIDIDAAAGSQFFINEGSATSSDFNSLSQGAASFANPTLTGNIALNGNTTVADAKNIVLNTTTGTQIGTANTQKAGFWGATPIVQPAGTAETAGIAGLQGSGTATTSYVSNTTNFNGNTGSKAYTVNDIVKALKTAGILAAS